MAADEMKARIAEDSALEEHISRVTIGTIHSFCLDLVQSRGNLIGLGTDLVLFESDDDRRAVLRKVFLGNPALNEFYSKQPDKEKLVQRCLQLISEQKRMFIMPENSTTSAPFPLIYSEYNQHLLEQNALDFDDILFFAYRILTESQDVCRIYTSVYRYICIDEAQDLNFAQYQVIRSLCGDHFNNIMMVGDPNQSIYGFNGSNSAFMTVSFVEDFSPTVYRLNENFRSAKQIVAFANQLEHYDSTTNYVYDGELVASKLPDEEHEAAYIADRIEQLLRHGHPDVEGPITLERIAVIARNKYVFSHLEKVLNDRGHPYHFKKNNAGIENESDLMRVFELALRILINSKDYIHLAQIRAYVGTSKPYIEASDSIETLKHLLKGTQYESLLVALEMLSGNTPDVPAALNTIEQAISTANDDERYLVTLDINQWRSHWKKYCMLVPRELRSLTSFRNQISLGKTRESVANNGISLLTAHMSKGLQYDVVFIMGMCEGVFPDYRALKSGGEQLAQETNNMYVAVTRAKRLCYITYPAKKRMPWGDIKVQSPSQYIRGILVQD